MSALFVTLQNAICPNSTARQTAIHQRRTNFAAPVKWMHLNWRTLQTYVMNVNKKVLSPQNNSWIFEGRCFLGFDVFSHHFYRNFVNVFMQMSQWFGACEPQSADSSTPQRQHLAKHSCGIYLTFQMFKSHSQQCRH